jgi:NDP-sugar pyrophosphorylase family protein
LGTAVEPDLPKEEQGGFVESEGSENGGVRNGEPAGTGHIVPAMLQVKKKMGGVVGEEFWRDLDALDAALRANGKIETGDGEFFCKMCKKRCKSNVYLLEHCWEQHRDELSRYQ